MCKLLKVFTLYPFVECHFKYDLIRSGIDFCINSDQYSMGTFLNVQKISWSKRTSSVTFIVLVIPGHHNETLKRFMGWRNQTALFNFVSCTSNQWAHHNCTIKWVIVMTNSSTWPWAIRNGNSYFSIFRRICCQSPESMRLLSYISQWARFYWWRHS